ncbi:MAG: NADAR domain-containing protein [Phycisphaerales bacterium]
MSPSFDNTLSNWCELPTSLGVFRMYWSGNDLLRIVCFGDLRAQGPTPLLRIHSSCLASEIFGAHDCDCADQLRESLQLIANERRGILCHMLQEGRGHGLSAKIRAVGLMQRQQIDTCEAYDALGLQQDVRTYGDVVALLKELGLDDVRLISNNPRKRDFLQGAGIRVEMVRIPAIVRPENDAYLRVKNEKLGHQLTLGDEGELTSGAIRFYHSAKAWGWLSNFSHHAVFLHDRVWPTVEHYYQSQKFAGTPNDELVRLAETPTQAKQFAEELAKSHRRDDWEFIKEQVMLVGLKAKFRQHPDLGRMLLRTAERTLVEHTALDSYWGDGGNGTGRNRLGSLLIQVRSELRLAESNG